MELTMTNFKLNTNTEHLNQALLSYLSIYGFIDKTEEEFELTSINVNFETGEVLLEGIISDD